MKFIGDPMWIDFGSALDCHANWPIGNLAIAQQIKSGIFCNFQDSFAMI